MGEGGCLPASAGEGGGGGDGQHHIKKYGSREGNEVQSGGEEEAVCLSLVFKRVLNVMLSEMANLIMPRVFAGVVGEMFTTVFHGDCVGNGGGEQESL